MNRVMIPETWRPWAMLLAISFLVVLINIDYTAVNMALEVISKELEADLNTLQWLLSGYILAWASAVVAAGQLADIFGKRRLLLIGIGIFSFASLWCGLASSETMLIMGRIVQGLGGALFVPSSYTIIFSLFPKNKQGLAIGTLGVGVGIGLAVGPLFGGAFIEFLNWRWIFLINVPLCLLTYVVAFLCLEKEPPRVSQMKFDLSGSLQLGTSLFLIMFSINAMEDWGTISLGIWVSIISGLTLLSYFIYTSKYKANRLIPVGLFSNKAYVGCALGYAVVEFVFSFVLVMMGLFFQTVIDYTAYESGLLFLCMTLAFGLLSPFGGKMVDTMDARIPTTLGTFLLVIGIGLTLMFTSQGELIHIIPALVIIGVGLGISLPSFNAAMMKATDPSILNTAAGVFIMFSCLGGSLGVVLYTNVLLGIGEPILTEMTVANHMDLSAIQLGHLMNVFGNAYRDLNVLTGMDVGLAVRLMNEAFIQASKWFSLLCVVLCLGAMLAAHTMIRLPHEKN